MITPDEANGIFITSALSVNRDLGRMTLPLLRGTYRGQQAWYVVTESSDRDHADRRGINWVPKLTNALGTRAVQRVRRVDGRVRFSGSTDRAE